MIKNQQNRFLTSFVAGLSRFLPLRHRYIFTKRNTLRMRYAVPFCTMAAATFLTAIVSFAPESNALYSQHNARTHDQILVTGESSKEIAAISPAAGTPTKVIEEHQKHEQQDLLKEEKRFVEELDQELPTNPIAFIKARYQKRQEQTARAEAPATKTAVVTPPPAEERPNLMFKDVTVGKGDTLAEILKKSGMTVNDAYRAIDSMSAHYDPRSIKAGQSIKLAYLSHKEMPELKKIQGVIIPVNTFENLHITKQSEGKFISKVEKAPIEKKLYSKKADIELSLFGSGLKAGIPASVIADAIYIYSWDVDFQRDIRKNDILEVMYEQYENEEGEKLKTGDILYARLSVNGQDIPVYRYQKKNGDIDYYTPDGVSVRKALMKTPVDGARISSGYGLRKHPVLGYNKMHKGVDFAAPTGTPIYAAGDGTIERANRFSSYGNYIRIRHNSELKTAYAHLQKFAKGISAGVRVKQGQVIGYIGTSGRSTGPHLHYEILRNGAQVNPNKIDLPQGETLKGTELARFKEHIDNLNHQFASNLPYDTGAHVKFAAVQN